MHFLSYLYGGFIQHNIIVFTLANKRKQYNINFLEDFTILIMVV